MFETKAFDVGAVDFIAKPASPFRVIMRVNAHLNDGLKMSGDHIRQIARNVMAAKTD